MPSSQAAALRSPSNPAATVQYTAWDLPTAAQKVAEGLPTQALGTVQERLALSNQELADVVLMSPRTIARRRKEDRLSPAESERVYRVARLIEIAARVFESEDAARAWMKEPNYALGEQQPLVVARTQPGAALVEQLLGRIEYGVLV